MKSGTNLSSLTSEEACTLKDNGIGNGKHTQKVWKITKKTDE